MSKSRSLRPGEYVNLNVGFTMENLEASCSQYCILLVEIDAGEAFRGEYVWAHARDAQGAPAGNRYPIFILNRALPPMEKARVGLRLWDRFLAEKHSHEKHAKKVAALEADIAARKQAAGKAVAQ